MLIPCNSKDWFLLTWSHQAWWHLWGMFWLITVEGSSLWQCGRWLPVCRCAPQHPGLWRVLDGRRHRCHHRNHHGAWWGSRGKHPASSTRLYAIRGGLRARWCRASVLRPSTAAWLGGWPYRRACSGWQCHSSHCCHQPKQSVWRSLLCPASPPGDHSTADFTRPACCILKLKSEKRNHNKNLYRVRFLKPWNVYLHVVWICFINYHLANHQLYHLVYRLLKLQEIWEFQSYQMRYMHIWSLVAASLCQWPHMHTLHQSSPLEQSQKGSCYQDGVSVGWPSVILMVH